VVNPQVRSEIPNSHVGESISLGEESKGGDGNGNTKITQQDEFSILSLVQWTSWVEVVDTLEESIYLSYSSAFGLLLVVVVARDVGEEVQWPAEKLLGDGVDESGDWSLLSQFVQIVDKFADSRCIDFTGFWDEDHVTLHVTGGLVVLSVGDFPGKVWNQKC